MKKLVLMFLLMAIVVFTAINFSYAGDIDPDSYKSIYSTAGVSDLRKKAGMAINIVQIGGTAVSLIALIVMGIKYMTSSPSEKADIKTKLVPYVTGTIIFFAASNLVALVIKFTTGM